MTTLNLASGASYFRSPEVATAAAISALHHGKTFYGPAEGEALLRKAIADRYTKDEATIAPGQVLVTPGTKQALFNLFTVLLREGDEVIIPTPAWFGFNELLRYSKGRLVTVPTTPADNYRLTAAAISEKLTHRSRILLLTNPGNPAGRMYSQEELEPLIALLQDYPNLYLICDEIYDLATYGKPFTSALACQGPQERIIVVNGFSKNFAMSGWRIGYIVASQEIIRQCADFQASTFSGVSMFVQEAATATLQHATAALQPMLKVLKEHRLLMQQGLAAIPHVSFFEPEGAYYFFPYLSHYLGSTTSKGDKIATTADLCHHLQQEYKLQVANGDLFGGIGHVRMSFAVKRADLQEAMTRLREALLQLQLPTKV
ncbi:MAG TPA: aminotransferase class I/II-fold pyridoxal phosphate-dependent enzyme [Pontibacter sp.]